jgi:hypothetical protein
MEGGSPDITLTYQNRLLTVGRQDLSGWADLLNARGANENQRQRAATYRKPRIGRRLKAIQLATPAISLDRDIQPPQAWLFWMQHSARRENQSGTGGKHRSTTVDEVIQGLTQILAFDQAQLRSAFTARKD